MLKNEKGISLVMLVITIVVMVVMISITISSSINSVEETNLTRIQNEIRNLKDAANDRMANYKRNSTLYPIIGEKIADEFLDDYIRSIEFVEPSDVFDKIRYNDETKDYYRLVGRIEAEKLGVEGIDAEHYYIIDYTEGEVYGPVNIELINNGG